MCVYGVIGLLICYGKVSSTFLYNKKKTVNLETFWVNSIVIGRFFIQTTFISSLMHSLVCFNHLYLKTLTDQKFIIYREVLYVNKTINCNLYLEIWAFFVAFFLVKRSPVKLRLDQYGTNWGSISGSFVRFQGNTAGSGALCCIS